MIEGVLVHPLKRIPDDRGRVMHMLRADDPHFERFGEIYFSAVFRGRVKGWHLHKKMTLNYAVVWGAVKLALYDVREGSKTRGEVMDLVLDEKNYSLVRVPPGVWNGFQGLAEESVVANCATIPHDPGEIVRLPPDDGSIPYRWDR